jgi:hypothetical protein
MPELGDVIEDTATYFQALGSCNLLLNMDLAGFGKNLVYSAFARRWFLKWSRAEGNDRDEHLAISRSESFFDAVAAGAIAVAREIVDLSPDAWIADGEYEDDFYYFFFLHRFIQRYRQTDPGLLSPILAQFGRALEGGDSSRLDICKAFAMNDGAAFGAAFEALINAHEEVVYVTDDPTAEPRRNIFVEGLALLRIAERVGFVTESDYRYCPGTARLVNVPSLPEDIFAVIDRQFPR